MPQRNKVMKRKMITYICFWISIFTICPVVSGQTDYTYEKGKSFQNVPAFSMIDGIDLTQVSSTLLSEKSVPEKQQTIAYTVQLPEYSRGIFFSRDSRPEDFEWPNNTNRLLPWTFMQLQDLCNETYSGIPSNATPSPLGDALLLELVNGEFLFIKAVAGTNSLSWLQVNPDGSLRLYLSTLGKDFLAPSAPLLLVQKEKNIYGAFHKSYQRLINNKSIASLKRRTDKTYFEAFQYLGWCTWEHYHSDIDETKILSDLKAIEKSGIPIRYILIDDGHLANKDRMLTSFLPDPHRFPSGWKNIMAQKKEDKIKWMGLWYSLSGYWMGLSPQNEFPDSIQNDLYKHYTCLLPGSSSTNIEAFYQYYVKTLKLCGFDFLKVDNQAFTLPLYMGETEVIRQARACNSALEAAMHKQNMGLMNCMAQNVINTDHTLYSNSTRVSIDYKKYDEDMAKSHLFQSYTNTLLFGQTVWPDHDMFHSSDTICGALMARSKAISGGPVYLSDSPQDFIKEYINPLIDEKGKIYRPSAPAIPTPESILSNPIWSGKSYRVFAPVGDEAMSLICYNLNTSSQNQKIETTIRKQDFLLRNSFAGGSGYKAERVLLFDWEKQEAEELIDEKTVNLNGFSDKLFHLCPIRNGWAVIGIQEKYLSPATVSILSSSASRLKLSVSCPGTLKVWFETTTTSGIKSFHIDKPQTIVINK